MGAVTKVKRVHLDCGHPRSYMEPAPVVGDEVFCVRCDKMATVETAPDEWQVRCRDCTYSRMFGAAKLTAEMCATRHWNKYRHHVVDVLNGKRVDSTAGDVHARADRVAGTRAQLAEKYAGQLALWEQERSDTGTDDCPF